MLNDSKFFEKEISPAVTDDKHALPEFRRTILEMVYVLREVSKIQDENINLRLLIGKQLENLDTAYAAYHQWIADTIRKITDKVQEVRGWN